MTRVTQTIHTNSETDELRFSQADMDAAIGKRLARLKLRAHDPSKATLTAATDVQRAHDEQETTP